MKLYMLRLTLLLTLITPLGAEAAQPFAATPSEMMLLPQYCQAKYGRDRSNPAAQERWRTVFGIKNWRNMHHYCDALKEMLRANNSIGEPSERLFHLQKAHQGLKHIINVETTKNWALRPEAYTKLGAVSLDLARITRNLQYDGEAVASFNSALEINPRYVPPYRYLSDFYADQGKKEKALEIVKEGLKYVPKSRSLKRRLKELGGK